MKHRVLVVVTHLLGVGHLARAALIARALAEAGASVRLVSGGRPSATVDLAGFRRGYQLPPIHCLGTDFKTLRTADSEDRQGGPSRRAPRERCSGAACRRSIRMFWSPSCSFGRRQLAEIPGLAPSRAQPDPNPTILCSIRDILQPPSKPQRAARTLGGWGAITTAMLITCR